ncbi:hypothetical protein BBP40_003636 [Aspergillus hancockii]|nr:hypothetical protein BBP40_003636 [Aspergillus hancockii]
MASADGRHIYIAIDAAKSVLKHLMERLNPTKHLSYLPVPFYLRYMHSFFFSKFHCGVLELRETTELYRACSAISLHTEERSDKPVAY